MISSRTLLLCILLPLTICCGQFTFGADPANDIQIDVPKNWRRERITLPPSFAKELGVKGVEEIRFAPGMFQPKADDFFSYVIVFRLDDQPKLGSEALEKELLVYYRGLAKAVGRGKIKTDGFSMNIKQGDDSVTPAAQNYVATLKWIEPFASKADQTLRIEIRVREEPKPRYTWVFMSVSPRDFDNAIWKTMRKARDNFATGE